MASTSEEIRLVIKTEVDKAVSDLKNFNSSLNKTQDSTSKLMGTFKTLKAGIYAAVFSAATKQIYDFVKSTAQLDTVSKTFNNLSSSFGADGKKILESMKIASRGTMSEVEMMRTATQAMSLMGQKVIDKLPQMTEVAMAAARTSGQTVAQMMNDLVVASGRQSIMILDNLNISSASARKYMDEYAASLGKTVEQLNATEKSQAFFNAVIKAGQELINRVDLSKLTLGEKLQIASAQAKNFSDQLKLSLLPLISDIVGKTIESSDAWANFGSRIGSSIAVIVRSLKLLWDALVLIWNAMTNPSKIIKSIDAIKETWKSLKEEVKNFGNIRIDNTQIKKAVQERTQIMAEETKKQKEEMSKYLDYIEDSYQQQIRKEDEKYKEMLKLAKKYHRDIEALNKKHASSTADIQTKAAIEEMNKIKSKFDLIISTTRQVMSTLQEITTMRHENEIAQLESKYSIVNALIESQMNAELANEALTEDQRQAIKDKYAKKLQEAQLLAAIIRHRMAVAEFRRQQQFDAGSIIMNTQIAIAGAWAGAATSGLPWWGIIALGAASTILLNAMMAVQLSQLQAQHPPPFVAEMAEGGIIPGSRSGTIIRAGEGGKSEAIIPLENDHVMSKMGNTYNIYFDGAILANENLPTAFVEAIDRGLYRLKKDNNSIFAGT